MWNVFLIKLPAEKKVDIKIEKTMGNLLKQTRNLANIN